MAEKNITRIIKKYPNRRLYDTKESQYITLDNLRRLVKHEKVFQVIDAKSGVDLTRATLLQIIYQQEEQTYPLLTFELLKSIIGFYDDPMHSMLSRYLEHSISVFRDHQADLKSPLKSLLDSETQINMLHELAEETITNWQDKK
ncbi:MAG: polyhydroxyalkanoate synthesis repressor PhaR [Gammaproteobacteria bacterium]|nr:polyhydroxyalkanoate synthesis repressor PhaR [Gammaproteobacteria bacterium]